MLFRKARKADLPAVAAIYEKLLDEQDAGHNFIGWQRGVYPTIDTARSALAADDLYVLELPDGLVAAAARINQEQVDGYAHARWEQKAPEAQVLVLHTLVVDPACSGQGLGTAFVGFYEQLARERGCPCLRMDTNERNLAARALYKKLGYREADVVPCTFNGIDGVRLVCLEKTLSL